MVAVSACSSSDSHRGAPHWSYHGAEGPERWGSLSSDFEACAKGTRQAPIDVVHPTMATDAPLVARYRPSRAVVVNNGHSLQADTRAGGDITYDDTTYPLVQMHFHSPSETTFNGVHFPVELHFVNTDRAGKSVVIATMVRPGAANPAWQPYIDALGLAKGASKSVDLDWSKLLPTDRRSIQFDGSLTTPPCTEGVRWVVLTTPITMSPSQISAFAHAYSGNNRPTQPRNGRSIVERGADATG
jgi:carbonic anhydrase